VTSPREKDKKTPVEVPAEAMGPTAEVQEEVGEIPVEEQVEEEKAAGDIMAMLKRTGDNEQALMMLDRELGQRPAPAEEGAETE